MRPAPARLPLLLALAVAVGCTSGDITEFQRQRGGGRNPPAASPGAGPQGRALPPPKADPTKTARVGLILATNSPTWQVLVGAAPDRGVVVLFVQPDGPGAAAGVKVGDVITSVDGEASTNVERAVVQLRSRPNQRRVVQVSRAGGEIKTTITITARVPPPDISLLPLYDAAIERNPEDAVARFLRAQAVGDYRKALADLEEAIRIRPGFVEAINLRAQLNWSRATSRTLSSTEAARLSDRAFTDWNLAHRLDPTNTGVLVSRGKAFVQGGSYRSGLEDAEEAIRLDDSIPAAHHVRGKALLALSEYDEAAASARRAIDLNPYDLSYYELLAQVFCRLGRQADARRTVEAIIDLVGDQDTRRALADVAACRGR